MARENAVHLLERPRSPLTLAGFLVRGHGASVLAVTARGHRDRVELRMDHGVLLRNPKVGEALEVQKRGEKFFLRSTAFDGLDSDQEVLTRASSLLELINGAASLSIEGHTHVGIHGVVQVEPW